VDGLLGKAWNRRQGELIELEVYNDAQSEPKPEHVVTTCACGSGVPVQVVVIAGKQVTLAGLPLIFQQFAEAGKSPNETNMNELMEMVKIYNPIPSEAELTYRQAVGKAYSNYWFKGKGV
jgi:hypothetical protein